MYAISRACPSIFIDNLNLNVRCSARVGQIEEMGSNPSKNSASTGTMTRIVKEVSKWYKPQWNRQGQVNNFFASMYPSDNVCFT